ncbi:MAG: porin family protein [Aestuariivirga sp.]|uniref:outer membrane protein n=1 Tax=Aestuariivirga sp. TaxID=2650926 RepID=UPI0025C51E96|nr:hypothetical protein [Aestuariivirga sp.]MCA3560908.1 porin family protein [Aestuariivirga sp.]
MKTLLLASCATLMLAGWAGGARAGDLGLAGSTYDWSGGYLGVNAGAAINSSEFSSNYVYTGSAEIDDETRALIDNFDFSDTADDLRFTGGFLAGYNWQYSNFVLGAEADVNYIGFNSSVSHNVGDAISQVMTPETASGTDKIDYSADWFGTVRARLGYAMSDVLIYGTGGLAWGHMKIKQSLEASNNDGESLSWSGEEDGYRAGWTLGGGIEYGAGRWLLGAEYLYVNLGSYNWGDSGDVFLADETLNDDFNNVRQKGNADYAFSVVRATLKYRF